MRELDSEAINKIGIPSIVLMENASRGCAASLRMEFPLKVYKHVLVVAGPGNNGGDGIATGRILAQWGYSVTFLLATEPAKLKGDPAVNLKIIENLGFKINIPENGESFSSILSRYSKEDTFIVDALFGTGLKRPVESGKYSEIIKRINNSGFRTGSIDVPSGLSEEFAPVDDNVISPDVTITFQSLKILHLFPDDRERCGKIIVRDIGIPVDLLNEKKFYVELITPEYIKTLFGKRRTGTHKGDMGHNLVIAGSAEKPGAAILSSIAALRAGAGLTTCAISPVNRDLIIESYPELMTLIYEENREILEQIDQFDAILAGPGMGTGKGVFPLVSSILENSASPIILDADAINVLGKNRELLKKKRNFPLILTPHPKEFSRLSGETVGDILNDPVRILREFSMEYGSYVILKGHYSIISTPSGRVFVNQSGNAGMATAGSGDILGGIVTGLIAQFGQKLPVEQILCGAVFIHGFAGDIAVTKKGEAGLIASDILEALPEAYLNINEFKSKFQFS